MSEPITLLAFTVPGTPLAKGSLRYVGRGRHPINDNPRLVDWQSRVAVIAADTKLAVGLPMLEGPVKLVARFYFQRPRRDYGTGRNAGRVRASAPTHHTKRPDLDKLVRAVLDALTKIVWLDDSQVVGIAASKRFGDLERLEVAIETAPRLEVIPARGRATETAPAAGSSSVPERSAVGGRAQPAGDTPHPTPLHIIPDNRQERTQ